MTDDEEPPVGLLMVLEEPGLLIMLPLLEPGLVMLPPGVLMLPLLEPGLIMLPLDGMLVLGPLLVPVGGSAIMVLLGRL